MTYDYQVAKRSGADIITMPTNFLEKMKLYKIKPLHYSKLTVKGFYKKTLKNLNLNFNMTFKSKYLTKNKLPYFISEIGINHNGFLNLALKMIKYSKKAGFNAVKFQKETFTIL